MLTPIDERSFRREGGHVVDEGRGGWGGRGGLAAGGPVIAVLTIHVNM